MSDAAVEAVVTLAGQLAARVHLEAASAVRQLYVGLLAYPTGQTH